MSLANTTSSSRTLYVKNLNDKIKKSTLKRYLYTLFMSYGRVVDIVALKTMKMRGQAFIVFEDPVISSTALKALQGFIFFGKPMVTLFLHARESPMPTLSARKINQGSSDSEVEDPKLQHRELSDTDPL